MENEKENNSGINTTSILFCLIVGFGWTLSAFFESSHLLAFVFCVVIIGIIVGQLVFIIFTGSNGFLERKICKQLDISGFRHEKLEGQLFVYKNDSRFQVQLADSYNSRIKHLYIYYKFQDDDSSKISIDGWSRASNVLNINHTDTIFVVLEDHFCCCYQTSIGNPRDFMKEFGRAYDAIGEVMVDYGKLFPYLERDYPNRIENNASTSIGFKQI